MNEERQVLAVLAILVRTTSAIVDLACTTGVAGATYLPSAVNCPNVQDDSVCARLYPNPVVSSGANTERPGTCFNDGVTNNVIFQPAKDAAIAACPRTCGYCCVTPEYTCGNKPLPRIRCNTIVPRMCNDPIWRPIIADDCPNVCGFCLEGSCVDLASNCAVDIAICRNKFMQEFVDTNCKKTCQRCNDVPRGAPLDSVPTMDIRIRPRSAIAHGHAGCAERSN